VIQTDGRMAERGIAVSASERGRKKETAPAGWLRRFQLHTTQQGRGGGRLPLSRAISNKRLRSRKVPRAVRSKAEEKRSQSFDRHIAGRIRLRRMTLGIFQETLGKSLGISFQQIQKYEKGTNRVSAGRLWEIAKLFNTPISWFFGEIPGGEGAKTIVSHATHDILRDAATVRLARAFGSIRDARLRGCLLSSVDALANGEGANA